MASRDRFHVTRSNIPWLSISVCIFLSFITKRPAAAGRYILMGLLYYISYLAIVAAFVFVTLSLASGLLYVSELIEEHTRIAKVVGQRGIYVIILLHVLFYFFDSLPPLQITFSITCHIVYLQNFSNSWPLISLTSPSFLASCALVIADHFIWFFYFARKTNEARHLRSYRAPTEYVPGFTEIASFFGICVWFAPLFLFLSLSANENALPVSAAEPSTAGVSSMQQSQSRVSLVRSMLSFLSFDRLPGMKASRKDTAEGLLAPHTPNLPRTPSSQIPSSPMLSPSQFTTVPRSPGLRTADSQELDVHFSTNANKIKLSAPPRRSTQGPVRRTTGDSVRIGQRRVVVSPYIEDDVFKDE